MLVVVVVVTRQLARDDILFAVETSGCAFCGSHLFGSGLCCVVFEFSTHEQNSHMAVHAVCIMIAGAPLVICIALRRPGL